MSVEVGIVGLPNAGSTTLFRALTRAGAQVSGKEHVGMAPIPDPRLQQLAGVVHAKKVTPAAVRVVDVPGTGAALLGNLRQVDALLAVLDGWSGTRDPAADLETLKFELPPELETLTTKPLLAIENGPGGVDAKLEAELADLPEEEAAAFREGESALGEISGRLFEVLDLVTFFTASEKETRAWTLRRGGSALEAAATIHSDIARGFIRCEVIRWDDLVAAGSHTEAARQGRQRLEGKTYVVQDGDVLNVRFNV